MAEAEITLKNTGKVGFDFSTLTEEQRLFTEQPLPGQPLIVPSKVRCSSCFNILMTFHPLHIKFVASSVMVVFLMKGHLEPYAEMRLSVYYLPGIPEVFHKTFQLQVAFYEAENITVRGEGIFPRLCLDLPRDLSKFLSTLHSFHKQHNCFQHDFFLMMRSDY